jgi:poly(beta-D-mannuronate) lyase
MFGLMALTALPAASQCQRAVPVSSDAQLASALSGAQPGDCISLANGSYSGFTVTHSGTANSPIVIQAANLLGATVSSGIIHLVKTSFVTISGLIITTHGSAQTVDGESFGVGVWFEATKHCRLTRSRVSMGGAASNTQWVMLSGASDSNEVDHSEFGPNTVHGNHYVWPRGNRTIPGVTPPSDRTSWANGNGPVNPNMVRHTLIDFNYFHDQGVGSAETIVLGGIGVTGDYQDTFTTVENNLFVNSDGDPEVISVKSSSNTIRYNTLLTCGGVLSGRSGNNNSFYGNFVLGGGKSGSGGVKLNEMNHVVYNNYIENVNQYPIMLENGDPYSSSTFAHAQVVNAHVAYNTVVNGAREVLIGHGSRTLPPTGMIFANNVISGTNFVDSGSINSTYSQNISFPNDPARAGFTVVDPKLAAVNGLQKLSAGSPAIGFANANFFPFVTDDMDGQARDSAPDAGADEFSSAPITRRPLTTSDVGPNAAGAADFSVSASPNSQTVVVGGSASYTVTVGALSGSPGTINLAVSGLPTGASAAFSPASINNSGSSTLNVSTSATTVPGTYTLTITGATATLAHSATVILIVKGIPDFTISASPSSRTVTAGNPTTYTVTVGALNGFSGTVSLNTGSLPTGVSASFNPASVTTSGTSTLSISTTAAAATGTLTITLTGASGATSHNTSVQLTVNPANVCTTTTATAMWNNFAFPSHSGTFTATFDATPSVPGQSSAVGLSLGAQAAYSGFANIVVFTPSGTIQARNGGSYTAASTINFSAGVTYHFRLAINVTAHTYSIFVTPAGGSELTVGSSFAFRNEQNTVTSLDHWGALVNTTPGGTLQVCNFTVQ